MADETFELFLFRDADGTAPLLGWLDSLPDQPRIKCFQRMEMLQQRGNELRRPIADHLEDGILELRARHLRVHYRILYFFHGKSIVVVSHGLTKTDKVSKSQIELAKKRRGEVEKDPGRLRHPQGQADGFPSKRDFSLNGESEPMRKRPERDKR